MYKVGEDPKECSTRGDKPYVGDLIAFLGPSQFTPYWIGEITQIRTKTYDFAWYDHDEKGRFKKLEWVETKPHMWCSYLHWRFKLNENGTVQLPSIQAILNPKDAYPSVEDGIYYRMRKKPETKKSEKSEKTKETKKSETKKSETKKSETKTKNKRKRK